MDSHKDVTKMKWHQVIPTVASLDWFHQDTAADEPLNNSKTWCGTYPIHQCLTSSSLCLDSSLLLTNFREFWILVLSMADRSRTLYATMIDGFSPVKHIPPPHLDGDRQALDYGSLIPRYTRLPCKNIDIHHVSSMLEQRS